MKKQMLIFMLAYLIGHVSAADALPTRPLITLSPRLTFHVHKTQIEFCQRNTNQSVCTKMDVEFPVYTHHQALNQWILNQLIARNEFFLSTKLIQEHPENVSHFSEVEARFKRDLQKHIENIYDDSELYVFQMGHLDPYLSFVVYTKSRNLSSINQAITNKIYDVQTNQPVSLDSIFIDKSQDRELLRELQRRAASPQTQESLRSTKAHLPIFLNH